MTKTELHNLYLKKALIRFLKENDCYKEYLYNIKYNTRTRDNYVVLEKIDINHLLNYNGHFINNSFSQAYSNEGLMFWKKIALLWNATRVVFRKEYDYDDGMHLYFNHINFNAARIVLKHTKIYKLRLLFEKIIFNIKYRRKILKIRKFINNNKIIL